MRLSRRTLFSFAASAGFAAVEARLARAQTYPDHPVRLVVPFPPGGAYDALGRVWADKIKSSFGAVVIENIGGAGASMGSATVARARPDGYTLLLGGTLPHVNETLLKTRPLYNAEKDLDPIMRIAIGHVAIALHPSVPATNLADFVKHAKANPGRLSFGHVGIGSTNHLTGELFKSLAGLPDLVQIPYRGAGPVTTDLIGGQIPMGIVAITGQSLALHREGKLRIVAVTSLRPLITAPELPTAAQAGFPGLANQSSYGLLAPTGTPKSIQEQIARTTQAALSRPDYQQTLLDAGFEATPDSDPDDFRQVLANDVKFWAPVVKQLNLKID